jgi:hypothetical protein
MAVFQELFFPDGTLLVLALLLARRFHADALGRLLAPIPLLGKRWRTPGRDLLAFAAPRSLP